ncbi:hypothetical protein CLORY_42830 [Clostridium oryzae]|uniref:Flavodoxin domain-containing protein n=2 Tax=Clostridium oryzae TaxID=1450648 RepID=A0A1V4I9M0_9CLOT|nr:flavodoxin domain-containing protein [Clostridium oryzae]OPJ56570.1 hypothetical protein CLORY_42830 [Clostridium oryzae]
MSTTIYYFSGTGNSLKVAKDIAGRLENSDIIPISSTLASEKISTVSERIGIVLPIYIYGLPKILSGFISKLDYTIRLRINMFLLQQHVNRNLEEHFYSSAMN